MQTLFRGASEASVAAFKTTSNKSEVKILMPESGIRNPESGIKCSQILVAVFDENIHNLNVKNVLSAHLWQLLYFVS